MSGTEVDVRPDAKAKVAWCLFAFLFVIYSANGRETPTYDSQPTKYAARELALYGRLTLDDVVARVPGYASRPAFQKDLDGHWRSAYSIIPSVEAAGVGVILHASGLVDLRAPLAPNLLAKVTASLLTAAAVALVFLSLARSFPLRSAVLVSLGLGLGTNLWPLASGTLWQLETVIFGEALALYAWFRPNEELRLRWTVLGAAGLALAVCSRVQTLPIVCILLLGLYVRLGLRKMLPPAILLAAALTTIGFLQWNWFGSVFGAMASLQQQNLAPHDVSGTLALNPWMAGLGLLVSPNRGLLVFSPVVVVALLAVPRVWRAELGMGERWLVSAAAVEFACYSFYSMWWGGHTYGPRYLLDVIVLLTPCAAMGMDWVLARRWRRWAGATALGVSVVIAASGAICYPNDGWNGSPDVDRHHDRVWSLTDLQVIRCWQNGPSPQTFSLFSLEAVRQVPPPTR